jgi:hypothetical protein
MTEEAYLSKWTANFPSDGLRGITGAKMREFVQDTIDTFQSVDGAVEVTAWKDPVAVATTANITLSGEQTIDGVLTSGSRVLVKDQSNAEENGIYDSAAGAWSRSTDADAAAELEGAAVSVQQGTVNKNRLYIQTADNITLGTTDIAWQQNGFDSSVDILIDEDSFASDLATKAPSQQSTKAYIAAQINSNLAGLNWKQSVKCATTANITLSGAQTIDGISAVAADRVLVKNQSSAGQNGIYIVAAGAWTRATDNDSTAEMQNAVVSVDQGTTNADTSWRQSADAVTVGSSSVTWVSFGASGSIGGSTGGTDNAVIRADGTGGSTVQASTVFVTDDGRLYGSAIHNNAGAVTGTTNQYVASGTYTPTLTAVNNVAASTAYVCNWIRVGNVVTVSGKIDVDPTAVSAISIGVSLPIASNFTAVGNAGGTGARIESGAIVVAVVTPDTTNDRVQIDFIPTSGSNLDVYFHFTYLIN